MIKDDKGIKGIDPSILQLYFDDIHETIVEASDQTSGMVIDFNLECINWIPKDKG